MIVSQGSPVWRVPGVGSEDSPIILGMKPFASRDWLKEQLKMKLVELDQNSDEWLAWRNGGVGASDASSVMDMNPWRPRSQFLAEKVAQLTAPESVKYGENEHTRRGKRLEPEARDMYEAIYGWGMAPVCVVHDDHPFVKASLDGLREDHQLVLEIKCPSEKWHRHTLDHGIPDWYACQVQHQLLITGAPVCHFVSYRPQSSRKFKVIPVPADPEFQAILLDELVKFWAEVQAEISAAGS